ncbi:probably inactive leucine-rich repeat receptor-like protein kinase IMK2 [Typha angustifolia]|uniref:probably inactive leucine-rich repeat receptor-like protein kinase IMK2 n=1 Tax=Typha angustifolia TaxID=59011 RepID=UPI003C2F55A6
MDEPHHPTWPSQFFTRTWDYLLLFFYLVYFVSIGHVPCQAWDGVLITQADYQGLQAFKYGLDDPRGVLRSWNDTGLDACSGAWAGIKCVRGKVIAIQLPWRGLGGHISEKVGELSGLRKLSLHDNAIRGQIPSALGFLRDLRGVYLFNNRLSGAIPPSIGNCLMLQTLDLSNNSLTGSVPSSISNSTRLYRLNLSYNNLSGLIPTGLTRLTSLAFLLLRSNNLSGSIPDSWEASRLQILQLDDNSLSGSIPSSLGRLTRLQELSLSNNQLNGSFPATLCNLSSLVQLNLDGNQIGNKIPEAIDGLRNLTILSLHGNHFDGEIPPAIGNISSLSHLDLSENNLTGEIPASIEKLANLTYFNVSDNNLFGSVPLLLSKRFNSSSFSGNIQLCGFDLSVPCPSSSSSSSPPVTLPSPSSPSSPRARKLNTRELILTVAGIAFLFFLLLSCVLLSCLFGRRSSSTEKSTAAGAKKPGPATGTETEASGDTGGKLVHFDGPLAFTADDLLCATAEIMGKSTYGTAYKATLEDGSQVAVKRLREKIAKGQKEFEAEVAVLGKIRHRNLLALRAYYLGPKGEKLLVFDYMPKGSLAALLHGRSPNTPIDWPTRLTIATGIARGLHHLHTTANIIHGNLTSSNILLDPDSHPKISDFGLSRLMSAAANSNVVAAAGALGYRAPELSKLKKAGPKTDVYSLGVVLLELLTGKSPAETTNGLDLPQWVASAVKEEWSSEVFDDELAKDAAGDELVDTLKLALHCVDPSPAARPEVQEVLRQLERIKPAAAAAAAGGSEPSAEEGKAEEG